MVFCTLVLVSSIGTSEWKSQGSNVIFDKTPLQDGNHAEEFKLLQIGNLYRLYSILTSSSAFLVDEE